MSPAGAALIHGPAGGGGISLPQLLEHGLFPLLPWFFLYCAGYFLWGLVDQSDRAKQLLKPGLRPLSFLGRHSLLIYLIHQPVLMAVFTAAGWIWG